MRSTSLGLDSRCNTVVHVDIVHILVPPSIDNANFKNFSGKSRILRTK